VDEFAQHLETLTRMGAPQLRELWQKNLWPNAPGYVQKDLVRAIRKLDIFGERKTVTASTTFEF